MQLIIAMYLVRWLIFSQIVCTIFRHHQVENLFGRKQIEIFFLLKEATTPIEIKHRRKCLELGVYDK